MTTCFVYVLQSEVDGSLYVGISSRLQRRVREHNGGHCRSTLAKRPWRLVYKEQCATHAEARQREKSLKSGGGRRWLRRQVNGDEAGGMLPRGG